MSAQTRQAIIDETVTWLRTPYHHMAAIKGAGVDCAQTVSYTHLTLPTKRIV